jgi:inhibitor of cysteine peptidase
MKRFFGFLLFTVILAVAYFTIASVFTQPCEGAELHISAPLPPQPKPYPAEVYTMTDAEFFKWATEENTKARAEWEEWAKTAPPRWISYDVTDTEHNFRDSWRGRGITGYNYAGYEHRYMTSGQAYGSRSSSTRHYTGRYLNPDYYSRPLTIINPYCRPKQQLPVPPPDRPSRTVELTEADSKKTVSLTAGASVVVSLAGNLTTGYSWQVDKIEGDAIEQSGKIDYKTRPHAPGMLGVGGTFLATFKAVKLGTATVTLHYARPWEKDKAPAKTVSFTFRVVEGG